MKAVILLSGGMDSTVLAYKERAECDLFALTMFSSANRENQREVHCARKVAHDLHLPHLVLDITSLSPLFQDETTVFALGGQINWPDCYAKGQRGFSLSVETMHIMALGYALEHEMGKVLWAIHEDDVADKPSFIEYLNLMNKLGRGVKLITPFLGLTKRQVAELGIKLGVDLSATSSCLEGTDCGTCRQCLARQQALESVAI